MRILIAEDESVSRRVLEATLDKWGHEVVVTCDGAQAWDALRHEGAPLLAILIVLGIALLSVVASLGYVRLTGGPRRREEEQRPRPW